MLPIIATVVIGICGAVVFFIDDSKVTIVVSLLVFICASTMAWTSSYVKEILKLDGLKFMSIVSMALVAFQLCISAFRVRKYIDRGERFAVLISIIYLVAQFTLIYTLHSTKLTLKNMNRGNPPTPTTSPRVSVI